VTKVITGCVGLGGVFLRELFRGGLLAFEASEVLHHNFPTFHVEIAFRLEAIKRRIPPIPDQYGVKDLARRNSMIHLA